MNAEKLYITAKALAKDAEILKQALIKNKPSLATLAADAATLAYEFAKLRVEIIERHERDQRGEK